MSRCSSWSRLGLISPCWVLATTNSIAIAIRYFGKGYHMKDAANDSLDGGLDALLVRLADNYLLMDS